MTIEKLMRMINNQHTIPKVRNILNERELSASEYTFDPNEVCFLKRIGQNEGMTQAELSCAVFAPAPTVTRKLNKLTCMGLLERRDDSKDYRKHRLYLTEEGKRVAHMLNEMNIRHTETLFEGFSEEEREQFANLLERMRQNADRALKEHP